jgi:2-oxoglutarate ferredoxin oxidoreductase subunit beta
VGIGGNHFIHAARRNMDILVVLVNNFIYGMTGGQNAPTTPLTAKSSTMPFGNYERPFNLPHLAESCGATYVARWTSLHVRRLTKSFREGIKRKGFRFIEVVAPCSTLYARLNKLGDGFNLMQFYHDTAVVMNGADTREAAIDFQQRIICGKFVDEERPTFIDMMHEHYEKVLGDRYVPTPPEGGMIQGLEDEPSRATEQPKKASKRKPSKGAAVKGGDDGAK